MRVQQQNPQVAACACPEAGEGVLPLFEDGMTRERLQQYMACQPQVWARHSRWLKGLAVSNVHVQ